MLETIRRVSRIVTDLPAIAELDVDPLVATPDGGSAADLRQTVDRESLSTTG